MIAKIEVGSTTLTLSTRTFEKECKLQIQEVVDQLEGQVLKGTKYFLPIGEGVMVKALLSQLNVFAKNNKLIILDKIPPPLVATYGGALYGQSVSNLKG